MTGMIGIITTPFGEHVVPETVRNKVWHKYRYDGLPDRRFRIAPVLDRYYRMVEAKLRREWENGA